MTSPLETSELKKLGFLAPSLPREISEVAISIGRKKRSKKAIMLMTMYCILI